MNNRIIIGLTGPTGAGKSKFAELARNQSIQVIDCDRLARQAVLPGTEGLSALIQTFGTDILLSDGNLNRKKLAQLAFADRASTELLNETLLPHIAKLVNDAIKGSVVLLDAPTLFESGLNKICNATVAVLADASVRQQRIMERDHLTAEEALLRMHAGKPDSFYTERTPYILYNNGNLEAFLSDGLTVLNKIIHKIQK